MDDQVLATIQRFTPPRHSSSPILENVKNVTTYGIGETVEVLHVVEENSTTKKWADAVVVRSFDAGLQLRWCDIGTFHIVETTDINNFIRRSDGGGGSGTQKYGIEAMACGGHIMAAHAHPHIIIPKVASKRKSHTQLLLHLLSQPRFNVPTTASQNGGGGEGGGGGGGGRGGGEEEEEEEEERDKDENQSKGSEQVGSRAKRTKLHSMNTSGFRGQDDVEKKAKDDGGPLAKRANVSTSSSPSGDGSKRGEKKKKKVKDDNSSSSSSSGSRLSKGGSRKWTQQEDTFIRDAVAADGEWGWVKMGEHLNRTGDQCMYRWRRVRKIIDFYSLYSQ
jgi:hypothetical protein